MLEELSEKEGKAPEVTRGIVRANIAGFEASGSRNRRLEKLYAPAWRSAEQRMYRGVGPNGSGLASRSES
ncbi:MAG: hypothetical protein WA863_18440 [Methyloceanibacter sp.]